MTMLQDIHDRVSQNEELGLRYCFTCCSWEDDTDCYPGDHSRHCGHELKVRGLDLAAEYRLICTDRARRANVARENVKDILKDQQPEG